MRAKLGTEAKLWQIGRFMRRQPPLLPAETLRRVLRVARTNGTSVLAVAGFVALLSAAGQDYLSTVIGLIVSGSGGLELHGASLITAGDRRGLRWLVLSQVMLLIVVLGYVAFRITHVDLSIVSELFSETQLKLTAKNSGMPLDQLELGLYSLTYFLIGAGTVAYQGGLLWYYGRRSHAVRSALTPD